MSVCGARWRACLFVFVLTFSASSVSAQTGVRVSGLLLNSVTAAPVSGTVVIDELRLETTSAADGTFAFDTVPPGNYHFSARAPEFRSRRTEVVVGNSLTEVTLTIDP